MSDENDSRLAAIEARLAAIEAVLNVGPRPSAAAEGGGPTPAAPTPPAAEGGGPTFETRIGAHWLNRIGIAALLIGVAFFLKYAFENEWIGPAARVAIGVAAGCALLVWSEFLHRRGHIGFAHSIKVIAVGVLYLSIWAASQTYSVISNGLAFAAMIGVTATLVTLAIRHQSEFIAGLALAAGFLTPILLSTGTNHENALFTYLAVLDVAALVLIALYPWVRALAVAFFGTLFVYVGWYGQYYTAPQMAKTIGFASLFFLLFAIVPVLRKQQVVVLLLPFCNAFVYFAQLSWMIGDAHRLAKYAAALAVFFVALSLALPDELRAAHIAIAIGFITIAIPLQLDQLWMTLGWYAEAAALLLLARRHKVFQLLGSFALGLAVFRMLFIDRFHPDHVLLNMRALTYAVAVAIFAGIAIRARTHSLWKFAVTMLNALMLIALTAEVRGAFPRQRIARDFGWSALWMAYGALLMAVGFWRRKPYLRWLALVLIGITIGKVFLYDLAALERIYRIISFIGLGVILLAISFAYQKKWLTFPDES